MPLMSVSYSARLLLLVTTALTTSAAINVGTGPVFNYAYVPQERNALDTNAANLGVRFIREPPSRANCCFVCLSAGTVHPYVGTVTYTFVSPPGYRMQHFSAAQKASLFNSGIVLGEYATETSSYRVFFATRPHSGSESGLERLANFRHVNASNITVRYTLVVTNDDDFNVQLARDCDDAPGSLVFNASVVAEDDLRRKVVLVRPGSTWMYLDTGVAPNASWIHLEFDDSQWAAGPAELGYGDGDEATQVRFGSDPNNKHITTWFRRSFVVPEGLRFDSVRLGLVRDDGAVVYLNGRELLRNNMPGVPLTSSTRAINGITGLDEARFFEATVDPARLLDGTNVLAVEIRQNLPDSSDISFDLDLWGFAIGPQLTAAWEDDCLILFWQGQGFDVEEGPTPSGPWTVLAPNASSPYLVCDGPVQSFYRLVGRLNP